MATSTASGGASGRGAQGAREDGQPMERGPTGAGRRRSRAGSRGLRVGLVVAAVALLSGGQGLWVTGGQGIGVGEKARAAGAPCNTGTQTPPGATVTCTYLYTGGEQSFTVPAGVTNVTVEAIGAQGGAGAASTTATGGAGGAGDDVTGSLALTAGVSTLYVEVGGVGSGVGSGTTSGGAGGFNGGAAAASGGAGGGAAGGGGGASDIRTASRGTSGARRQTIRRSSSALW